MGGKTISRKDMSSLALWIAGERMRLWQLAVLCGATGMPNKRLCFGSGSKQHTPVLCSVSEAAASFSVIPHLCTHRHQQGYAHMLAGLCQVVAATSQAGPLLHRVSCQLPLPFLPLSRDSMRWSHAGSTIAWKALPEEATDYEVNLSSGLANHGCQDTRNGLRWLEKCTETMSCCH